MKSYINPRKGCNTFAKAYRFASQYTRLLKEDDKDPYTKAMAERYIATATRLAQTDNEKAKVEALKI